jgi:hypothetical protein
MTGEKKGAAPEPPDSEDEASERRRGRYLAAVGYVLTVAAFLGWLGMELLPASTFAEKSLIIVACLLLGLASLTGYGAWRSPQRFVVTAIALVLTVCLMGMLSVVASDKANPSANADGNAAGTAATSPPTASTRSASPGESPSPSVTVKSPAAASYTTTASPAADGSSSVPSVSGNSDKPIRSYKDFDLPCDYTMSFGSGGPPQPVPWGPSLINYDLYNYCSDAATNEYPNEFTTSSGEIALLQKTPTFANCAADTVLSSQVNSLLPGDTICFQGHGVLAAATVMSFGSSGGNDYVTFDVQVWRYPEADPQTNSGNYSG